MYNAIFYKNILTIKNIWLSNSCFEFGCEFIKRRVFVVVGRLDFYRTNFVSAQDEEVNFHMILSLKVVRARIKIQIMSSRFKYLSDNVFHKHTFVNADFVKKHRLIEFV